MPDDEESYRCWTRKKVADAGREGKLRMEKSYTKRMQVACAEKVHVQQVSYEEYLTSPFLCDLITQSRAQHNRWIYDHISRESASRFHVHLVTPSCLHAHKRTYWRYSLDNPFTHTQY